MYLYVNTLDFISSLIISFVKFPFNFIGALIIILPIGFFAAINSFSEAKRVRNSYEIKEYNRWYYYAAIILCTILVSSTAATIARNTSTIAYRAYRVPSGAMLPNIQIGERILVNEVHYRFNGIKRGDVVVFKYPRDPERDFLKRIIGLPGETIQIKNQQVYINDSLLPENYIQHTEPIGKEEFQYPRDNFGPFQIPQDSVFVMGDNRDTSMDSRYWGPLSISSIEGKAYLIYWSYAEGAIRWERIGKSL